MNPKKRFVSRLDRSRIAKGILPRSRKTARVTPQTRAEMSVAFDSLSPEVKLGFIECLWDSLPDKAARWYRWDECDQPVVDFERLPVSQVHDLNLYLKVHGGIPDTDGEGAQTREAIEEVLRETREGEPEE